MFLPYTYHKLSSGQTNIIIYFKLNMKTSKKILLCLIMVLIVNCQEEITDDDIELEEQDDVKIDDKVKDEAPKIPDPEYLLVQPIRRIGSSQSQINVGPCGGIEKGLANTLSNMGTKANTIWEVRTPTPNGFCTVSISSALEQDFKALKPTTKGLSYNENFSFACGRQVGFEYQEFELPADYACDHCTLQIKWESPVGTLYTCSDMIILGNKGNFIYRY